MEKMLIGAYIKQKREDKGWSQDALCEGICSRTTLSRIENDTQAPSFAVLKNMTAPSCSRCQYSTSDSKNFLRHGGREVTSVR